MYTAEGLLYISLDVQMRQNGKWHFERIPSKTIGTYQEQARRWRQINPKSGASSRNVVSDKLIHSRRSSIFGILPRHCQSLPTPPDLSTLQNSAPGARRHPRAHAAAQRSGSSILSRAQVVLDRQKIRLRAPNPRCPHPDRETTAPCHGAAPIQLSTARDRPRQRWLPWNPRQTRAAPRAAQHARRRPSAAWACSAQRACHGRAGSQSRAAAGCR